jgi:hypothetical protein
MKANIRSRNIGVNSYVGMFIVTLVGSFATLFILHIAHNVPFKAFASTEIYAID